MLFPISNKRWPWTNWRCFRSTLRTFTASFTVCNYFPPIHVYVLTIKSTHFEFLIKFQNVGVILDYNFFHDKISHRPCWPCASKQKDGYLKKIFQYRTMNFIELLASVCILDIPMTRNSIIRCMIFETLPMVSTNTI